MTGSLHSTAMDMGNGNFELGGWGKLVLKVHVFIDMINVSNLTCIKSNLIM